MRVAYILAASLIPIVAPGSPHFTNNDYHLEARQQEGTYYAVTGATGGLFPRLEIRELESAGGEMWNLFLLALTEFQAMDQHVIDSYFQIAGMYREQIVCNFCLLNMTRNPWYAVVSQRVDVFHH